MRKPLGTRKSLSTDEITRMYVKDGLSLRAIQDLAGISRQTVHNLLKGAGVTAAQKGRKPARRRATQYESEIRRLYVDEDKPIVEIARMLKLSTVTIANAIRFQGVEIKRGGMRTIVFPELRLLKIGESLELPRILSASKHTYVRYYTMAKSAGIKVSVRVISEDRVKVTRIS